LGNVQAAEEEHVIENGNVFRKSGDVNISAVHAENAEMFNVGEADFFACGLSLVLHQKINGANSSCKLALFRNVHDENGNCNSGLVADKIYSLLFVRKRCNSLSSNV
jgi:hypothetical protein